MSTDQTKKKKNSPEIQEYNIFFSNYAQMAYLKSIIQIKFILRKTSGSMYVASWIRIILSMSMTEATHYKHI